MNALEAMGLGWVVLAGGFSAVALGRLLRHRRHAVEPTRVPVLLLRPVDEPTERELENLSRPIDYAGPLAETALLGSIAIRVPETALTWDAAALKLTGSDKAAGLVRKSYRKGWEPAWVS